MYAAVQPWYGGARRYGYLHAAQRLLTAFGPGGDRRAYGFHPQRREARRRRRAGRVALRQALQQHLRAPVAEARLGAGAAAQAPRAHVPAARLAARDRLALPALREGGRAPRSSTARASFASSSTASRARSRPRSSRRTARSSMKKTCAKHGTFEDVMRSIPTFLARIERLYPGRDFMAPPTQLRDHGSSSASSTAAARCSPST